MKTIISTFLFSISITFFAQSNSRPCTIEGFYIFFSEHRIGFNTDPGYFKLPTNIKKRPHLRTAFSYDYKRNGSIKDSSLSEIIEYNPDGSKSRFIVYESDKKIWNISTYKYEISEIDSVVTQISTRYGTQKYFYNLEHRLYKQVTYVDSTFKEIKQSTEHFFDSSGIKKTVVTTSINGGFEQIWIWKSDTREKLIKIFINDKLNHSYRFIEENCCVEIQFHNALPETYRYYFDSNNYLIKEEQISPIGKKIGKQLSTIRETPKAA